MTLPRKYRLTGWKTIETVKASGALFQGRYLGIIIRKTQEANPSRLTVIASSRVARKATTRNKTKRRTRAAVRGLLPRLKEGNDCVVLLKKKAVAVSSGALNQDLMEVLERAGALKAESYAGEDAQTDST